MINFLFGSKKGKTSKISLIIWMFPHSFWCFYLGSKCYTPSFLLFSFVCWCFETDTSKIKVLYIFFSTFFPLYVDALRQLQAKSIENCLFLLSLIQVIWSNKNGCASNHIRILFIVSSFPVSPSFRSNFCYVFIHEIT